MECAAGLSIRLVGQPCQDRSESGRAGNAAGQGGRRLPRHRPADRPGRHAAGPAAVMSSSVEILGQWITLPDPDSVASLSHRYYGVCTTIAEVKSQLSAIGSPQAAAQWTGAAAGTFATRLGSVPGQLEQAWQSCHTVAQVLAGYSSNLRPVVAALRSLANQAEEAQGTLHATQAARDQALHAGEVSTSGVWNARLEEAREAVSQVAKRRSALLAELHQLSAGCARQIRQADPEGVHQDLFSDLKRYAVDAGRLYWRVEKEEFHLEFTVAK